MSASSWIRAQRDRPIAEHERRAAFAVVAVLSIAVALLLALTTPRETSASRSATRNAAASTPPAGHPASGPGVLTQESERAARVFLDGYLPYLYGRSRASEVRGATLTFAHSLTPFAPRVPPAMRGRHPRVVSLHAASAPAGLVGVTALVNDGGLVDYPIALLLARHGRGLLVAGLASA